MGLDLDLVEDLSAFVVDDSGSMLRALRDPAFTALTHALVKALPAPAQRIR